MPHLSCARNNVTIYKEEAGAELFSGLALSGCRERLSSTLLPATPSISFTSTGMLQRVCRSGVSIWFHSMSVSMSVFGFIPCQCLV